MRRLLPALAACAVCLHPVASLAQNAAATSTEGWRVSVGAGPLVNPAYKGDDAYQLSAVPYVRATYKDRFFASVQEGVGYNLLNRDGWRAGPLARYAFAREEDGSSPFRVAGEKTNDLRGLGDVDGAIEPGGFVEYGQGALSAMAELRQGIGGHDGLIGDLSASYRTDAGPLLFDSARPLIVSAGPRATLVSSGYNHAYFGVDPVQSASSGLPVHDPDGGLLSYGLGTTAVMPLGDRLRTTLLASYDRLAGDAGNSPLVRQRGARDQFTGGLFLTYDFTM